MDKTRPLRDKSCRPARRSFSSDSDAAQPYGRSLATVRLTHRLIVDMAEIREAGNHAPRDGD